MIRALFVTLAIVLMTACAEDSGRPAPSRETVALGERLYDEWACAACHGADRLGTENAPPLATVRANWTIDALAEYLLDPQKVVASDERLRGLGETYVVEMPAFAFPAEERAAVAAWLIEKSGKD